ncbi:hypothetical protein BJX99DRAFT_265737 [Aspergillus californicus]
MDTIRIRSNLCIQAFNQLLDSLSACSEELLDQISSRAIENDSARFKVWCGNLGALQLGGSCLDARLSGSTIMRETVLRFLLGLHGFLKQSLEITTGTRVPWDMIEEGSYSSDGSSSDESPTELGECESGIHDTIAHLYRLSFKIRNASHQPAVSAEALATKVIDPDTRLDIFQSFERVDLQFVDDSLRQLWQEVQRGIDSRVLIQATLSPPAYLVERLAKAITNRRRYFTYWLRHGLKLARIDSSIATEDRDTEQVLIAGTEVLRYKDKLDNRLETETITSWAMTAYGEAAGTSVDLPPPPPQALSKPEFVCPYCWVVCPSREGKGKAWRTHVLHDIQPYVCTFPDCSEGDRLYSSRQAWMEHERVRHQLVWRCFEPRHKNTNYATKNQLRLHYVHDHPNIGELQLPNVLDLAGGTVENSRTVCPFCSSAGPFDKGIYNHMAFHQESLARFALPKDYSGAEAQGSATDDDVELGTVKHKRSADSLHSVPLEFGDISDVEIVTKDKEPDDERVSLQRDHQSHDLFTSGIEEMLPWIREKSDVPPWFDDIEMFQGNTNTSPAVDMNADTIRHNNEIETYRRYIEGLQGAPPPYSCNWVGCKTRTGFRRLFDLKRHTDTIHIWPGNYPCPYEECDRVFRQRDHLQAHQRRRDHFDKVPSEDRAPAELMHLSPNNYLCPEEECDRVFRQRDHLQAYQRRRDHFHKVPSEDRAPAELMHLSPNNYLCPEEDCNMAFGRRDHFDKVPSEDRAPAELMHLSPNNYLCPEEDCNMAFGRRDHL